MQRVKISTAAILNVLPLAASKSTVQQMTFQQNLPQIKGLYRNRFEGR